MFHPDGPIPRHDRTVHTEFELQDADGLPTNVTRASRFGLWRRRRIMADPTITRFAIVREPIARFISGLLNKCRVGGHVQACPVLARIPTTSMDKLIDLVLDALENTPPRNVNLHFQPQHLFCGLERHVSQFDIVHFDHMVEYAHILPDILPLDAAQRVLWKRGVNEFLTVNTNKHISSEETKQEANSELTPERVARIRRYYAGDYAMFHFDEAGL